VIELRSEKEIRERIKSYNLALKQDTIDLEVGNTVIRELLWVLEEDIEEDLLKKFERWAKETQF
jgi:hypothetical protein